MEREGSVAGFNRDSANESRSEYHSALAGREIDPVFDNLFNLKYDELKKIETYEKITPGPSSPRKKKGLPCQKNFYQILIMMI